MLPYGLLTLPLAAALSGSAERPSRICYRQQLQPPNPSAHPSRASAPGSSTSSLRPKPSFPRPRHWRADPILLRNEGVDPARAANILALLSLPHAIYFLWGPFTDFWIRRRTWLILAATAAAATLLLAFHQPRLALPGPSASCF